ncbi:MAG TPA: class I SAM-dependent methyltransferase [Frankiaceae bacterium]|jgi:SAM-dependent methyltransferase|nr:class I SAM-dependent methyltransferase [Frankiaceae bacterium]
MSNWASGDAYEPFIGRWSRLVAAEFVPWLGVPPGARWLDVGCGTGALTSTVLALAEPASVVGVDPSGAFVSYAAARVPQAEFRVGYADATGLDDGAVDVAVAGLVLNFVPDPAAAVAELRRVARHTVGAYVWDYTGGMEILRHFWDAARSLDPGVADEDFPLCRPGALAELLGGEARAIDVPAVFEDFESYWAPFLGGTGPAPAYVASLDDERRDALREAVRERVGERPSLNARAWAVRARVT